MSKGWIKLYRQLDDCYLWHDKPFNQGAAWVDLLLMANHRDAKIMFDKKPMEVKAGCFITSELKLSDRWGWSRGKVVRFLNTLKDEGMIVFDANRKRTSITIVNYSKFQESQTTDDTTDRQLMIQQTDNRQTTDGQQTDINKNDKNIKNDKNEKNEENEKINTLIEQYNSICVSLPSVQKLSDSRKRTIKARLRKYSVDDLIRVFEIAQESDFLAGRNSSWKATFDWLMNENNIIKVLEGNYNNDRHKTRPQTIAEQWEGIDTSD